MSIKTIDLEKTPLTLEDLLARLDGEVLLMRGTTPLATLAPAAAPPVARERVLGLHEGQGWISDDFTDELPDSFWLGNDP
jgi:hypothetical protein